MVARGAKGNDSIRITRSGDRKAKDFVIDREALMASVPKNSRRLRRATERTNCSVQENAGGREI